MMIRIARYALFFSAGLLLFGRVSFAQLSPDEVRQLVKDVAYNELQDRERDSFWKYHMEQKIAGISYSKYQVETKEGPIFLILDQDGRPLSDAEEKKEHARLEGLLQNPRALAKNREDHQQDEERMQRLIALMPQAFLFEPNGPANGDIITLNFKPNPDFRPPTYEARVFHGMAGTIEINQRLKRFVAMHGKVIDRIDFGYGLLGYVDKGGNFNIHREQVNATHWKTDLVDVHVSGHVVLFKSVSKDHHEVRSDFHPVPVDISLPEAKHLLDEASQNMAELQPGSK
ncbi:hypothetical protein [Acidobacterium sp. S8]|uniref:hypothetical protein n=1 Tax=Acidobacterium sp. S8 TaxID=1641854 RepID=UPI00131D5B87|nr:hypothetical protein [Acidobacterium sp. S8]